MATSDGTRRRLNESSSAAGFYACLTRWARRPVRAQRRRAVRAGRRSVRCRRLSLEPVFRRIPRQPLQGAGPGPDRRGRLRACWSTRPADWPLVFAVDASTWDRCDAETSPERGFYYSASKHSAGQPIVAGWSLPVDQPALHSAPDSLDRPDGRAAPDPTAPRTPPTPPSTRSVAWSSRLARRPRVAAVRLRRRLRPDRARPTASPAHAAQILCRIRDDRVFYTDPPAQPKTPGTGGRPTPPRRGGSKLLRTRTPGPAPDPATGRPHDPRYGTVRSPPGTDLHPKLAGRGRWARPRQPADRAAAPSSASTSNTSPSPPPHQEDPVAVVVAGPAPRPRPVLARLPAPLRHRTHLPLRQEHPRLDHPVAVHPRAGRPLDLARGRRSTPSSAWPAATSRTSDCPGNDPANPTNSPPPASGEDFADSCAHRHPSQSTENHDHPDPDDPRAPENRPEPATRPSKGPRERGTGGLIASVEGVGVCPPGHDPAGEVLLGTDRHPLLVAGGRTPLAGGTAVGDIPVTHA